MSDEITETLADWEVTQRFHGFDLQRRNDWPKRWRARIVTNKNERADYRLEAFGDTAEEALKAITVLVLALDKS